MWQIVFFTLSWDLVPAAAYRRGMDSVGRRQYQVQHGSCSYTFLLPETDNCRSPSSPYVPNAVQRDAPLDYDDSAQRLQVLEDIMENNTQWLMKVGGGRGPASPRSNQHSGGRGEPGGRLQGAGCLRSHAGQSSRLERGQGCSQRMRSPQRGTDSTARRGVAMNQGSPAGCSVSVLAPGAALPGL